MRDIEDYFDPVSNNIEKGDEVFEEDIIRLAEEENLQVKDGGDFIHLVDDNDEVIYGFDRLGITYFGRTFVLTYYKYDDEIDIEFEEENDFIIDNGLIYKKEDRLWDTMMKNGK